MCEECGKQEENKKKDPGEPIHSRAYEREKAYEEARKSPVKTFDSREWKLLIALFCIGIAYFLLIDVVF